MAHRVIGRILLAAVVVSIGVAGGEAQQKGRYKKDGTKCTWDANDSGPNQCTPVAAGRFKKDGDNCTWEANETGADQCRPKTGRFKKDGAKCEWNASDSGPDQCDPRQAK